MSQEIDIEFVKNLPVVWLIEHGKFAWLLQLHAHYSVVAFSDGEVFYRLEVENDEYTTWKENSIDYESE
jgi:hypothetical protein